MKFCNSCGAEIAGNSKFCPKCGKALVQEDRKEHPQHALILQLLIGSMAFMGVYLLLAIAGKDPMGVVLSIGMGIALYFLGYAKATVYDYDTPQITCLITGIIIGLLSLIGVLSGQIVAIIGIIGAALPLYVWWLLQQKQ